MRCNGMNRGMASRLPDPAVWQQRGREGDHGCTSSQDTARQDQYE